MEKIAEAITPQVCSRVACVDVSRISSMDAGDLLKHCMPVREEA